MEEECGCWDHGTCVKHQAQAERDYRALSCKGKQDCDEFFKTPRHLSPDKPCGFHHARGCREGGLPFYKE